ncbi:Carbohydrate binding module (family 35) [Klenkia soli]|uniref:Carbohydrate binding module (Family 35) n=1 Tax=Klenkia soli TaxID=1052260 RepID=A0A1H0IX24_9ACTN|nr:AbfB domain-containing protein [Klenkia soli]SDO35779.1 Carbohydrate binding module (family 35) [Klenkia soli]
MHDYNSFCNAGVTLPDGRILMVGGNSTMQTMVYDPTSRDQTMGANLARQRWYATALRLPDDRVVVLGGADYYNTGAYRTPNDNSKVATTPEIGTGTGAWTSLTGANSALAFGATDNRWWYPRAFNGPGGTIVGTSGDVVWRMSVAGTGSVTRTGTLPFNPRVSGSQVMYAPGRVLVAGGGQAFNEDGTAATNRAAVVDYTGTTPRITSTASMASARNWLNLTVLPDGRVLASGGTATGTNGDSAVRRAEIWNPATGTWTAAATAQRIRTYHSTALVMPSGAVFTGGGGVPGPEDNLNAEMFYPPSLFTRGADGVTRWASRPTITTLAGSATYGGQLTLGMGDNRTIREASLISMGGVTHSYATDQRRVPLTVTQNGASVKVSLPTSANTLPAGDYLLSTVDSNGVPSAGQVLTIRNGAAGSVTVNAPTTATGGGTPATTPTGSVPLTVGTSVGLEAVNYPGYRVRHAGDQGSLSAITAASAAADQADSSFVVRTGLAGADGVSLESVNSPGQFLRSNGTGGRVTLATPDGTAAGAAAATFLPVGGLNGQNTSLQLWGTPGVYLRHQNFQLYGQATDGSDLFRNDATFAVRAGLTGVPTVPLTVGTSVGLEAGNIAGYLVRHQNFQGALSAIGAASGAGDKADSSFVVRPGLAGAGGISLEAVGFPGQYLRANGTGGRVTLARPDGTAAGAAAATFLPVTGLTGQGTSLQLWGTPGVYLRHQNYQLVAQATDGSALFTADASFTVRTGLTTAPAAAVVQGETGTLAGSAVVWTGSTGWTGTGYVANLITAGSSTTVPVTRAAAGPVTITVRYAAGGGGPAGARTLTALVGGQATQVVSYAATADWNTWSQQSFVVDLPAGGSTVGIAMNQGDTGWIDVDAITVG